MGSFEREVTLSSTVDKTYIGDHTIKMKAHVGSLGNQSPFQHVLRDHLGSVDTLMDAKTGAVLQHRGYDVFGRPRDIASGNALLSSWQGVTKGYTDHEHLIDQELIHMNGRIYDFNVGRFLSVDPFLQFPENSQSANPYSYILNNPMSGVDPTGYRSEELDEVISGKAFEKLEKDESGNLYVTADGETYKLTSVSNGEKNFSISFDGNGGGTAQVGKTTGTVSLHKGNSSTNVGVTGSTEKASDAKFAIPNKDVLGTKDTHKQATDILTSFEIGGTKEQGVAVKNAGGNITPDSCDNEGCTFNKLPANIRFVAHSHVESNHYHSGMAEAVTKKREMPGPGDHAFLVKRSAPNYFRTPSGVIKVLEFKGGQYHVRTLSTGSISPNWNPANAELSRREKGKAMKL